MWSIVQSPPVKCAPHCAHIGSKTVFAYSRAFAHSLLLCQSAISYSNNPCTPRFRRLCDVSAYKSDISSRLIPSSYHSQSIKPIKANSMIQGLIDMISSTRK